MCLKLFFKKLPFLPAQLMGERDATFVPSDLNEPHVLLPLPLIEMRKVASSMMQSLSLEHISMEIMIASSRFEFHRFMSYFLQERRQSSLPDVLTILENPLILKIFDEFCQDV